MSIFPRRSSRGQVVTLHLRLAPSDPCFPALCLRIVDPRRETVFEHGEQQPAWTPAAPPRSSEEPQELGPGLYEAPPLWFAAQHLSGGLGSSATLMGMLAEMEASRHWYLHWKVPEHAPLGRYQLLVSAWTDGREHPSPTRSEDHFFVESLRLDGFENSAAGSRCKVCNLSEEPTPVQLHEFFLQSADAGPRAPVVAKTRRLELPPQASTVLPLEATRGLLSYADGARRIWLNTSQEAPWLRSQTHAWMLSNENQAVVTSRQTGRSFTLNGPALRVWQAANGFHVASELAAVGGAAFHALCKAGLLVPLASSSHA